MSVRAWTDRRVVWSTGPGIFLTTRRRRGARPSAAAITSGPAPGTCLRDPHQGAPLCLGQQFGVLESDEPGRYTLRRPGEMVRCPWHGWEFDLRTGQSWFDPERTRVARYDVRVGDDGRQPGPYVAETYPVAHDRTHVYVEL